jgi:hypothetical protein
MILKRAAIKSNPFLIFGNGDGEVNLMAAVVHAMSGTALYKLYFFYKKAIRLCSFTLCVYLEDSGSFFYKLPLVEMLKAPGYLN